MYFVYIIYLKLLIIYIKKYDKILIFFAIILFINKLIVIQSGRK